MKASVVDLRYKMRDVLEALDKREKVTLLYHGKVKGVIIPVNATENMPVAAHPFFGMTKKSKKSVEKTMDDLRGARF